MVWGRPRLNSRNEHKEQSGEQGKLRGQQASDRAGTTRGRQHSSLMVQWRDLALKVTGDCVVTN